MVVSLDVTRIENSPVPKEWKQFNAIPMVAVTRMEYEYLPHNGPEYSSKPPDCRMPATDDEGSLEQMVGRLQL